MGRALASPMVRPDAGTMDGLGNPHDDASHVGEDLLVPHAKHLQPFELKGFRSSLIFRSLQVVDVAIHLDHEPRGKAVEVDDPTADHVLDTHAHPEALAS